MKSVPALWDVPPLMNSGITCRHYKRGGQSIDTHRALDTPRPSTLGMIAARGMEQKRGALSPTITPSLTLTCGTA
eukprot:scaffold53169_cov36-Cyclotella_meneghiniana.AAC.1